MSKTLYHSELSKLGIIEARVKSDVTASKYNGKPPYVILEIEGRERLYTVENDECGKALRGLKGRKVELEATGSRDEAAIHVKTLNGAHEETYDRDEGRQERREREPAGPETFAEQQAREAKTFVEATRFSAKMSVLLAICYTHARLRYNETEFPKLKPYELEDLRLRFANTLAIETKQNIPVLSLPAKWPEHIDEARRTLEQEGGEA